MEMYLLFLDCFLDTDMAQVVERHLHGNQGPVYLFLFHSWEIQIKFNEINFQPYFSD